MSEQHGSMVDICNQALVLVGDSGIISFNDGSTGAKLCDSLYRNTKRALLRSYPWNFAITRKQLAQDANAPANEWTYAYALPAKCLRVLDVYVGDDLIAPKAHYDELKYALEHDRILTHQRNIFLRYVEEVDEDRFDPAFADALAYELAYRFAYPLNASNTLKRDLFNEARIVMQRARSADNLESPRKSLRASRLKTVRR